MYHRMSAKLNRLSTKTKKCLQLCLTVLTLLNLKSYMKLIQTNKNNMKRKHTLEVGSTVIIIYTSTNK